MANRRVHAELQFLEKAFEVYPEVCLAVVVYLYRVPGKIDETKRASY